MTCKIVEIKNENQCFIYEKKYSIFVPLINRKRFKNIN